MCKSISIISGKGGCGKTTLALSMASLLSNCGIKVLLVDCDLCTNGATYFYEEKLSSNKKMILSFNDIVFRNYDPKKKYVNINENYDFMPSIIQISKDDTKTYTYSNGDTLQLNNDIVQKYDIVIFDCQSGYTDVLKLILPICDIVLMVMETDSISSAATRCLYLKIGDIINEKKIYQVFNKSSIEEYDTYSKVSGGTVFTNIETIKFDWKIKKAFSVSQIPDMDNTSANYGEQIFNVCNILFLEDSIKQKLAKFKNLLEIHKTEEKESELKKQLFELGKQYRSDKNKVLKNILLVAAFLLTISLTVFFQFGINQYWDSNGKIIVILPIVMSIFTLIIGYINVFESIKERRDYDKEINMCREELYLVSEKRMKLQEKYMDNKTKKSSKDNNRYKRKKN
ncbi:MAG: ParA family protein [Clostridia bacterium]|nr:ParA family protein [Clostridia bacterium]